MHLLRITILLSSSFNELYGIYRGNLTLHSAMSMMTVFWVVPRNSNSRPVPGHKTKMAPAPPQAPGSRQPWRSHNKLRRIIHVLRDPLFIIASCQKRICKRKYNNAECSGVESCGWVRVIMKSLKHLFPILRNT